MMRPFGLTPGRGKGSEAPGQLDAAAKAVKLLHNPLTAWVILVCGLFLTATAGFVSSRALDRRAEDRFDTRVVEITDAIRNRMQMYEEVLRGGVGFVNATGRIPDRRQWAEYVATLELEERWPGIQGMGLSVPVTPAERAAHVAAIRAEGFPDFDIAPDGVRDEYSSIIFLEPFDWRNQRAFGFDMWSDDLRREAMARARDTGATSTSRIITLVQETEDDVQQGFLTYLPVYQPGLPVTTVEERRRAFVGWVYAPFRMGDLMEGILGLAANGDQNVDYEIFDGSVGEESLLFDSDDTLSGALPPASAQFVREATIDLQGRQWQVHFASGDGYVSAAERRQPMFVMAGGLVIDFLLFYVISALTLLHRRARRIASSMTADLQAATRSLERQAKDLQRHAAGLEASNTELERFAYVASHDLQEPLRSLGNFSELLTQEYGDALDERGQRWLGHVQESAARMSALVEGLLDFCRLDNSAQVNREVCLDDALDASLANLASAVSQTDARIDRAPLGVLAGDPVQMQQLFQNLIGNAITYAKDGVPPVITIWSEDDPIGYRIFVRDNGIGIKSEYHERVFEIFRRLGSRTRYKGTGIGLATCRRIVERHGGEIRVDSVEGEGSTFSFTLALVAPPVTLPDADEGDSADASTGDLVAAADPASRSRASSSPTLAASRA